MSRTTVGVPAPFPIPARLVKVRAALYQGYEDAANDLHVDGSVMCADPFFEVEPHQIKMTLVHRAYDDRLFSVRVSTRANLEQTRKIARVVTLAFCRDSEKMRVTEFEPPCEATVVEIANGEIKVL